jgi:hypothetical protein
MFLSVSHCSKFSISIFLFNFFSHHEFPWGVAAVVRLSSSWAAVVRLSSSWAAQLFPALLWGVAAAVILSSSWRLFPALPFSARQVSVIPWVT